MISEPPFTVILLFVVATIWTRGKGNSEKDVSNFPLKIMMGELALFKEKEVGKRQDSKITSVGNK